MIKLVMQLAPKSAVPTHPAPLADTD